MPDADNVHIKFQARRQASKQEQKIEAALNKRADAFKAAEDKLVDGLYGPKTEFAIRTATMTMEQLKEALWKVEQEIAKLNKILAEQQDPEGYDYDVNKDEEDV